MAAEEKQWASKYLLDPLTEPEPNTESGPGSHFVPPQAMASSQHSHKSGASTQVKEQSTGSSRSSTNPFRRDSAVVAREASAKDGARIHHRFEDEKKGPTALTRAVSSGSNGFHAPRASSDLRHEAFPSEGPQRRSIDASRDNGKAPEGRRRRSSSLKQRYPGDPTDNPLGMLEKANLRANRSPHLRKQHQPRPDPIDALDESLGRYHHEGPYDAALFVRNTSSRSSPVIALSKSNREALKATPDDKIRDSLNDHRPLDGTAMVPPGQRDAFGRRYDYKEGTDMMRENGGDYKRWPGVDYLPEDLKGKGEPSYSIEEALKQKEATRNRHPTVGGDIELAERPRRRSSERAEATTSGQRYGDWESERRGHSRGKNLSGEIKKRVGGLRKKDNKDP